MKIEIEKPVVPKFVADWIEGLKERGDSKHSALSVAFGLGSVLDDCLYDWFVNNKDDFVTAVMYGYDIQKEPSYYAKAKGWELIRLETSKPYWCLEIDDLFISTNGDLDVGEFHTKMTKTEWNELGINDSNADFEKVKE